MLLDCRHQRFSVWRPTGKRQMPDRIIGTEPTPAPGGGRIKGA
jgi:hypothetical protein